MVVWCSALGLAATAARLVLTGRRDPDSDEVDVVSVLQAVELRSTSSAFMGGSTLAILASLVLDLRRAGLGPTGADLTTYTFFASTKLVVPPDWRVEVDARTWLGGLDISHEGPEDPDAPVLRLHLRTLTGAARVEARPRLQAV